jgi:YfiH family protein
MNLAGHVGDTPEDVTSNRKILRERIGLPEEPRWLPQVHGCSVAIAGEPIPATGADAAAAFESDRVCAVLTADCLPVLLCDRRGTRVAAVHAGWRGLAGGVIEAAAARLDTAGHALLGWLGPAIGPSAFEVGDEVRACFIARLGTAATAAFVPCAPGKWLADLFALATRCLHRCGITAISGGGLCTYSDPDRFFSYRRDGVTGRMATLIWIAS